jgi:signal transduction histidine kinase
MKRLQFFILIFSLALCIPLAYFVFNTYRGLEKEEMATLRYFAEALLDEMQGALAILVQKEEARAVDEYNYQIYPSRRQGAEGEPQRSPLAQKPLENYIIGYFQNNPDGSFQTPLVKNDNQIPPGQANLVAGLQEANQVFNRKRVSVTDIVKPRPADMVAEKETKQISGLADKYLNLSRTQRSKAYLGQKDKRVEKITVDQAANIAQQEQTIATQKYYPLGDAEDRYILEDQAAGQPAAPKKGLPRKPLMEDSGSTLRPEATTDADETADFQVEVAPLQAVFLSDAQIFIFRRIMINNQIYRQGFVLQVGAFLQYLSQRYFLSQPMAQFAGLKLAVLDQGREADTLEAGVASKNSRFRLTRAFPSPFNFLEATLTCEQIPRTAGRRTLTIMLIVLAVVILLGLFAIYRSARTIVDLSERRSQFVSSVTHELKTPLTNIRMYIELLEQGVAKNPEREQEYFRILESEGARLSRLINNVLELARLEKKQRHLDLQLGTFEEVIREVRGVMAEKLKQTGFTLEVELGHPRPFLYDSEIMIQVLINLIENSMKFGKHGPQRLISIRTHEVGNSVTIAVADTGPGIPRPALKKIFNDFYRVENSYARTTRGTGIGLALVKKFAHLMGGTVSAANNDGPGCTITLSIPASNSKF